ncbi:MAG: NFYB/HAP3 family transcription factor subunit [Thermoplasmatales archaeon]|nr:NFYB/HAP3 family transcription factor subunit [Thermoplasmatales archaeon]
MRKNRIPLKIVKCLMKEAGAKRISKSAVEAMTRLAEDNVMMLTGRVLVFMEHANRTTLQAEDVRIAQTNKGEVNVCSQV